jgi:hypothetical protein
MSIDTENEYNIQQVNSLKQKWLVI